MYTFIFYVHCDEIIGLLIVYHCKIVNTLNLFIETNE